MSEKGYQEQREDSANFEYLQQKFQGIPTWRLITTVKKDDYEVFGELIRRYEDITNDVSKFTENTVSSEINPTTQALFTAIEWLLDDPSVLVKAAENKNKNLDNEVDAEDIIREVLTDLTLKAYNKLEEYRKLPEEELQQKVEVKDPLAMYIWFEERNHSKSSQRTVERITIVKPSNSTVLGGRLFTEDYVEIIKEDGIVVTRGQGYQFKGSLSKYSIKKPSTIIGKHLFSK